MKPGDKVWVFNDALQKIQSGTVTSVTEYRRGHFWVNVRYILTDGGVEGVHVFPTREALCEHYKKIFE